MDEPPPVVGALKTEIHKYQISVLHYATLTGRSRGLRSAIRWFGTPEKTPTESI
jgi:hypothetical protein